MEVAYNWRKLGEGATFWERKIIRVRCSECGATLAALSIQYHMDQSHGIIPSKTRGVDMGG